MATAAIILIVVAAVVSIGLLLGRRAQERQREKRIDTAQAADSSYERAQAEAHRARAEVTNRVAKERARRERVAAELHGERVRAGERET